MPPDDSLAPLPMEDRTLLRDRLAALGELAAGMAHDYNNILGTIGLYCEVLLRSGDLNEADRERVSVILLQARRGARLTRQVLDFARRSDFERRPFDLKALVEETKGLLKETFPREVVVSARVDGDRFTVDGDAGRLQQALMNLAINARDAMPEGGRLEFDLAPLKVAVGEPPPYRDMHPGEWLRLRVQDTGQGIPPEARAHIFEPFFTTKPSGRGTGLGLAQVYGIVKRHGGYISLQSELGVGTTFTLYLPMDEREAGARDEGSSVVPAGAETRTVLVIHGDEGTRAALVLALETLGHSVTSAATGNGAVETLRKIDGDVDVVLCDAHLPDREGEELIRAMADRWDRPSFIVMTGVSSGWETRQAPTDARHRWLDKPFTLDELAQAVGCPSG